MGSRGLNVFNTFIPRRRVFAASQAELNVLPVWALVNASTPERCVERRCLNQLPDSRSVDNRAGFPVISKIVYLPFIPLEGRPPVNESQR